MFNINFKLEHERNPVIIADFEQRAKNAADDKTGDFIKALWSYYNNSLKNEWGFVISTTHNEAYSSLINAYSGLCGYPVTNIESIDDFFHPALSKALTEYLGGEEASRIRQECAMIMEFPYVRGYYRSCYRSKNAADYIGVHEVHSFFLAIFQSIDFICCDLPLEEMITKSWAMGIDNRAALALRNKNDKTRATIEEAILGDNNIILSRAIILAIVKSGDYELLELLGKLLLVAKGQEGLRQSILESCDLGTLKSHAFFINLILENGLCRFSSVIRAFGTWSGLAYGDQSQKHVEKCMALALTFLSDESAIETSLESPDTIEIYLALWALAYRDVHNATSYTHRLLASPQKYKRLVGWYFITHTADEKYCHDLAVEYLHLHDLEELAWATNNLSINHYLSGNYRYTGIIEEEDEVSAKDKTYPHKLYPEDAQDRASLFDRLAQVVEFIGKKSSEFKESVFPWYTQKLSTANPCWVMLGLAAYDRNPKLTHKLARYLPLMDSSQRLAYYARLLNPEIAQERVALLEGLSDKSQTIRERIISRLNYYPIADTEIARLTKSLTSQSASLRTGIMSVLRRQDEALIIPAIDILLEARNKNQLIAGVELLDVYSTANPALKNRYAGQVSALTSANTLPQDIIILLEKLNRQEEKADTPHNLYNPKASDFDMKTREALRPAIPQISDQELKSIIIPDENTVVALYERLADVLVRNKDYEYEAEYWAGMKQKVLLGDGYHIMPMAGRTRNETSTHQITDYPLADEWLKAAGEFAEDKIEMAVVLSLFSATEVYAFTQKAPNEWYSQLFNGYPIERSKNNTREKIQEITNKIGIDRGKLDNILHAILETEGSAEPEPNESSLFDFAFLAYVNLVRKIPIDQLGSEYEKDIDDSDLSGFYDTSPVPNRGVLYSCYLRYWRHICYKHAKTDAQFTDLFNELWYQFIASGMRDSTREGLGICNENILRAHHLGLVSRDAVLYHFMAAPGAFDNINQMTISTYHASQIFEKYPAGKEIFEAVVDAIITTEGNRGELPTPVTNLAANIHRFDGGVKHFINILAALGDAGFYRGYQYAYANEDTVISKTSSLSRLLRCCYPTTTDTSELLRHTLKEAKIPEKRAMQAAIYAPQWAGLLEKAMGIPGLKSGVWFFHAHVNENFTVEKETEVAIFAAITPQEFADGVFDKNWFFEAYNNLGEKRFNELYKNAKYITDSNSAHRRSQLYTDAVLGRLDKNTIKIEIKEKRNQEKLRAYALIPLDENSSGSAQTDALERYEFIQRFKKESREYGAARQASEGRAADIAIENLAITTGYGSTDRMIWALEGAKIEQLRPLMSPQAIGEIEVRLAVSKDGTPELIISKNGMPQKTVPKSLAKHESILKIKNAAKELRSQKSRARHSLEAAMISCAKFTASEIAGLLAHPVLGGMVSNLVFVAGDLIGFPSLTEVSEITVKPGLSAAGLKLTCPDGVSHHVTSNLTIAHPHDFIEHRIWSQLQRYVFREKITQPFKQVFREYYPITQDELDAVNLSRRYAGHQVQPKKTVTLLKTRGWSADYEDGLQRVWHKENIIVRMYALADWFSPADIEAPTLEEIRFFNRKNDMPIGFIDVPAVVFSETMRDIDLAVSVAHVGSVDPEASHSTIEMRTNMARELLSMLRVENVSFKAANAIISGSLGEYSVHMGSGVMHKLGTGMLTVLPVHSQSRGRIFLPFVDEDPKTAEILAKILLFADDIKIKDPGILTQING